MYCSNCGKEMLIERQDFCHYCGCENLNIGRKPKSEYEKHYYKNKPSRLPSHSSRLTDYPVSSYMKPRRNDRPGPHSRKSLGYAIASIGIGAIQFLIGQVMRVSKGQANPKIVGEMLKKKLSK